MLPPSVKTVGVAGQEYSIFVSYLSHSLGWFVTQLAEFVINCCKVVSNSCIFEIIGRFAPEKFFIRLN